MGASNINQSQGGSDLLQTECQALELLCEGIEEEGVLKYEAMEREWVLKHETMAIQMEAMDVKQTAHEQ